MPTASSLSEDPHVIEAPWALSTRSSTGGVSMSIIEETMRYLATSPGMLEEAWVASLSPVDSMVTLAYRSTLNSLLDVAGKPFLWPTNILRLNVLANGLMRGLSSMSEADRRTAASSIESELLNVFGTTDEQSRGQAWKLLREVDNMIVKCEELLPQKRRLEVILGSRATREGRQRLSVTVIKHHEGLQDAERSVFHSAVFRTIAAGFIEPEEGMSIAESRYLAASDADKAYAIGNVLRNRVAILNDDLKRDRSQDDVFLKHVLGVWMHMINFNGHLGKVLKGSPDTVHYETPYRHTGPPEDEFSPSLMAVLPFVLAYCRYGLRTSRLFYDPKGASDDQK